MPSANPLREFALRQCRYGSWGVGKPYIYPKGNGQLCVSNVPPRKASGWPADNFGFIARNRLGLQSDVSLFGLHFDLSKTQTARFFSERSLRFSMFSMWGGREEDALAEVKAFFGCVERQPGPAFITDQAKMDWVLRLIGHISQACKERGAELIVVGKPTEDDYRNREKYPEYNYILAGIRSQDIHVIDTFDEGMAVEMPGSDLFTYAGHLSATGNRLAAQRVVDYIIQNEK